MRWFLRHVAPRLVMVRGMLWCLAQVTVHPMPDIMLLAPVNGETFSSLPIVVAYRITGVDVVELYCDMNLKERYDQAREEDGPAVTALLTNPQEMGGLYISGMHSFLLAGRLRGAEAPAITRRVDFFMDMPSSAHTDLLLPPPAVTTVHTPAPSSLVEETGFASVLLIGNFRAPGGDEASSLAGQYKRALRTLGVFVHTRQEDFSDAIILESTLMAHKPDLVLYVPELELIHGTSDLARLWNLSERLGIATAVMLSHLHTGFTINASDTLWQANYVVSADPTALSRWPRQGRGGSWHHIWLAPAAAIADDDRLPVRAAECFGSFECWSRPRDHLMQQGREDLARGAHADTVDARSYMYDVIMLTADARQEHMHAGPICLGLESSGCCAGWQHGIGLRRRVAAYLARAYGHRFHHGIKELRQRALSRLVRSAKVTVVIGDCLQVAEDQPCPTPQYWGDPVYTALRYGAFVLHNLVPGIQAHFTNGTHLALFNGDTADLSLTLGRQLEHWLHPSAASVREHVRRAGQQHVLVNHTHLARLDFLLRAVSRAEEARAAPSSQSTATLQSLATFPSQEGADAWQDDSGGGRGRAGCVASAVQGNAEESLSSVPLAPFADSEAVWLDDVLQGAEGGVQVQRVSRSVFEEHDRFLAPARALPGEEVQFTLAKNSHALSYNRLKAPRAGSSPAAPGSDDEGMQLLALPNFTVTVGGVLCNDTHVVKSFLLHEDLHLGPSPPGCFGAEASRVVRVRNAIFVPTRWGDSWQHFVQNAAFRLVFALETLPETTQVILETQSNRNLLAVAAALLPSPPAWERLLFVDSHCMSGIHIDFRKKARKVCGKYWRANWLFIPTSYPGNAMDHQPNPAMLRVVQSRVGAFLLSAAYLHATPSRSPHSASIPLLCPSSRLPHALSARSMRSPSLTELSKNGKESGGGVGVWGVEHLSSLAAGVFDWLWQCVHSQNEPTRKCLGLTSPPASPSSAPPLPSSSSSFSSPREFASGRDTGESEEGSMGDRGQGCVAQGAAAIILSRGSGSECAGRDRLLIITVIIIIII
jgi:hypothetical protein